ncbi:MAG: hypothetical protein WBV56_01625 [Azonexus sp.]
MPDNERPRLRLEAGEDYPKTVFNPSGETPHYVRYMDKAERGLHAIKLFVYAGMTAFVILSIFGFYLIARLTEDATRMANSVEQMQATMQPMGQNMMVMTQSLMNMTESVNRIQYSAGHMDRSFSGPMNTINRFMPFGGGGGDRAAYPPTPFVPQRYTAPPANAYMGQPIQQQPGQKQSPELRK